MIPSADDHDLRTQVRVFAKHGLEHEPTLTIELENSPGAYIVETELTVGGRTHTTRALGSAAPDLPPPAIRGAADSEGPFCVVVRMLDIEGASIGESPERCFEVDEFPELERRQIDNTTRMSQCVEEPVDPEEPGWVGFEDKPDVQSKAGDGGDGCSTTSGDGSLLGLLLLGLASLRRRRG